MLFFMPVTDRSLLHVVDTLYSCTDKGASWVTFLGNVAEVFEAKLVGLTTSARLQAVVGLEARELSDYNSHYLRLNPWLYSNSFPEGKALLTEQVMPLETYKRTPFYNEWGRRNEVTHAVGGAVRAGRDLSLFLSVNRGDKRGEYNEDDRDRMQILLPFSVRCTFSNVFVSSTKQAGFWIYLHFRYFMSPEKENCCG
jgi:hypothetical protein